MHARSFNKLFKGPTAGTLVGTDSFGNRCVRVAAGRVQHHASHQQPCKHSSQHS